MPSYHPVYPLVLLLFLSRSPQGMPSCLLFNMFDQAASNEPSAPTLEQESLPLNPLNPVATNPVQD